ncbi:MAG: tetratricopeptide repeat protein [Kofleriaceae bacterium]
MSASGDAGSRPSKLGRYELITQIGQGGMAEVQLALQRGPAGFEKLVVVKLVHENLASQKPFVDMLLDEARVAALLKHPNVVDIYDLGEAEGRYFIAMEYLEGEPLLAVLRAGREGKRLDPLSTARLIADTGEGLDAAHELRSMAGDPIELVHHDVSLGNIVVLYNGQVKLVDFGVAKATIASAGPARIQGKFSYMAPEKLRGGSGDRRSDIWSLGCVLWEALTLRRLFKGGNDNDTMRQVLESVVPPPSAVNSEVLADFDPIVMRALERDPAKRYPSAKEMATDIEEVLRKQGYGGRNDLIAKYMTATFETHIVARKKLLQEVSSKGRASAAVLHAAFDEPPVRNSSILTTGDFSVKFRLPPSELTAEGTPQSEPHAYPRASPEAIAAFGSESAPEIDHQAEPALDVPTPARKPPLAAIGMAVGALMVLIVVIAIATRGGSESRGAHTTLDKPIAAADAALVEPVETDAAVVVAEPTGLGSDATQIEIDPPGSAAVRPPRPRSNDKPNAVELHRVGLQEFVAGDYRAALATLKRAQAANPGYAPTYRGLGMVHVKLGQSSAAKLAFQRYLALSPHASDASSIRARMEQL